MPLQAGTHLGPYEVLSLIGAGGMGEVYRARDTRLDRSVAVKVLAPELVGDPEFRARFVREAKAISALNHPHICGLYDIGRTHDGDYLVLELLEGETLAARLARGPLPPPQVLRFGTQIADALEAAHRLGIVHRDLKPGNVMLTPAGIKLLDFGLATHTVGSSGESRSMLATAPGTSTAHGTLIGTLQYMAPEQVQGLQTDARTDIFALGTVLYEMATGRRTSEGATHASLIAKILETEPPAVSSLAPLTPAAFDHVVQGCLAKAPADRWQTAHDVKMELQWIQADSAAREPTRSGRSDRTSRVWLPWAVAGVVSAALAATGLGLRQQSPTAPAPAVRFDLRLPPDVLLDILSFDRGAISPDGQRFVFTATVDGHPQLVMRTLASSNLVVLPGTDNAFNPFWSPDGQSVAFFVDRPGALKKMRVPGGRPEVLAEAEYRIEASGTWASGAILFGPRDGRIYSIADTGGTASPIPLRPNPGKRFESPRFLPDGRHFIVNVSGDRALYLASVDGPGTRKLLEDGLSVAYAAGHLFYARGVSLCARPFDVERLEFSGAEIQVAAAGALFSVSHHGSIVYRPEHVSTSRLTWFDRDGRRVGTVGDPGPYQQLLLSRRGRRAILVRGDTEGTGDLWDANLVTGVFSRLTTDPALDTDPSLSPDERMLAFTSFRTERSAVFLKDLVSGTESPLVRFDQDVMVDQWTPDGRFIVFRTNGKAVYAAPMAGDRTPRRLADMPFTEDEVHVSPDGKWVAFDSDESGRWEVYVAAFPTFTSKRQVSSAGGVQPQWRADGAELFYLQLDRSMMSVRLEARSELTAGAPVTLFPTPVVPVPDQPQFGVTADGQRFLALDRSEDAASFTFLLNALNAQPAEGSPPAQ